MTIDLTSIANAVIALIAAIITAFVIPWIRSKTTAAQFEKIKMWVTVAVEAAEQLYTGSGRGAEKKAYVVEFLNSKGFKIDAERLDKLIEAAVFNLPDYFVVNGIPANPKKQNISYIFQEYSSFPWLTVEQNIRFGLEIKKTPKAEADANVEEMLDIVGLTKFRNYYPSQLSISMLQRVAIARAFATKPELLLMDEPYGQLDIDLRFKLEDELIKLWKKTGTTVLFITHNIEEAVYLSQKIMVLTNKPTSVKTVLDNPLPLPRDVVSPEFVELRNKVTDLIKWW